MQFIKAMGGEESRKSACQLKTVKRAAASSHMPRYSTVYCRSSMQLGLIAAQLDKSPLRLEHGNFKICKPTGRTKQASGAPARCQRVHTHVQPFTPEPKFANFAVMLQTEGYASNQIQLPARHMPAMASAICETGMMPSELLIPERSEKTGPQPLRVMNKILNDPKQSIRPQLLQRRFGLGKSGSWRFHPLLIQGNRTLFGGTPICRVVKVAVPLYTRRSILLTSPTPGKITKHAGSSNRVTHDETRELEGARRAYLCLGLDLLQGLSSQNASALPSRYLYCIHNC